jgi:hypothetical protein
VIEHTSQREREGGQDGGREGGREGENNGLSFRRTPLLLGDFLDLSMGVFLL